MKVIEPTGYDVEVTTEEIKIIRKFQEILQDIKEILEEKGCDTLMDKDSGEVDLETIETMLIDLDVLMGIEKMF